MTQSNGLNSNEHQPVILKLADRCGPLLAGRPLGQQLRKQVEEAATTATVVVDLAGVEAMSPSFADEFFAKMPSALLDAATVQFDHVTDDLASIISTVTAGREQLQASG
jgi:hypothetical protein